MAVYLSTALRTGMLNSTGMAEAFNEGVIDVYSGPQPANADAAPTGTKLLRVTNASAAYVLGVAATQTLTSNGSDVSNADTVTVNGKVYTFKTTMTGAEGEVHIGGTAATSGLNLVRAVNNSGGTAVTDYQIGQAHGNVVASGPTANVITLTSRTTGTGGNTLTLAKSAATLTAGAATFSGGVDASGLAFDTAAAGVLAKATGEVWSGIGLAAGTMGWARFKGNPTDSDGVSTTLMRMDGSVANSGVDFLAANVAVTVNAPSTIDTFTFTLPAT